jgi:hypothetical protein
MNTGAPARWPALAAVTIGMVVAFMAGACFAAMIVSIVYRDRSSTELQAANALVDSYRQQEQEWMATDAAFIEQNAAFKADARQIINRIRELYATDQPHFGAHVARIETKLGAAIEFGIGEPGFITDATVKFAERNRDHGIAVARLIAGSLVGPQESTQEYLELATLRSGGGVLLLRYPRGIVGTSADRTTKQFTVSFTPTKKWPTTTEVDSAPKQDN